MFGKDGWLLRHVWAFLLALVIFQVATGIGSWFALYNNALQTGVSEFFYVENAAIQLVWLVAVVTTLVVAQKTRFFGWLVASFVLSINDLIAFFSNLYYELSHQAPNSFTVGPLSNLDAVYVAVTTFTSVGSGQIEPAQGPARAMVTIESFTALITVALGVALVVAIIKRN